MSSSLRQVAFAFLLAQLAVPRMQASTVSLGGTCHSIMGDTATSRIFVTVQDGATSGRVVALELTDGTIADSVTMPEQPGPAVLDDVARRLYVALLSSCSVAVVDADSLDLLTTIPLTQRPPYGPASLAVDPPRNRLYVGSEDGVSIVDTLTDTEIYWERPAFLSSEYNRMSVPPRGGLLHVASGGTRGLFTFDVRNDGLVYVGRDCCHGCLDGTAPLLYQGDGRLPWMLAGEALAQLSEIPLHHREREIPVGRSPAAMAWLPGRTRVAIVDGAARVLIVDLYSGLVSTEIPLLAGQNSGQGMAVSPDGRWAAVGIDAGSGPTQVEVIDLHATPANRGGLKLRAIDAATGRVLNCDVTPLNYRGTSTNPPSRGLLDVSGGVRALAPLEPGVWTFDVWVSGAPGFTVSATINAGEWTDLGTFEVDQTRPAPSPETACVSPPVVPGTTVDVTIHGRHFEPGAVVESLNVDLTLNSYTWVAWDRIEANVTAAPAATPHWQEAPAFRITNPDSLWIQSSWFSSDWTELASPHDATPPVPVPGLRLRRMGTRLQMDWNSVDTDEAGNPELPIGYDTWAGHRPDMSDARLVAETGDLMQTISCPEPGVTYLSVRARDAAANAGQ